VAATYATPETRNISPVTSSHLATYPLSTIPLADSSDLDPSPNRTGKKTSSSSPLSIAGIRR
jgi:hypothetical protein